jgi:hypothetical protein
MLNGYWLFCEPNTRIARDPDRLDEFISLFKHACLFQREVNLSDLMVIASPNFRRAYHSDLHFKALVHSPWVNISFLHRKGEGTGLPMDLIDVKDFHHYRTPPLYCEEDYRYFEQEGSDRYLRALQTKPESTLPVREGAQRDPIFTRRILEGLDGNYLKTHLGEHQPLFAEITRDYQARQARRNRPLGAIHFENGRKPDGSFRFQEPMIWDLYFEQLGDRVSATQRDAMSQVIWRFYRANLVRAESDLMTVDPIQPPENQFYVDVHFGKSLREMVEQPDPDQFRVYSLFTALDDATLYRHLDFATIENLRQRANLLFDAAASRQTPQDLNVEEQKKLAIQRASAFETALVEYLHVLTRELTQRFSWARQPSLARQLMIRFGTLIEESAVDERGRPRTVITEVVNTAWNTAVAASALDTRLQVQFSASPQISALNRYLTNFVAPLLWISDSRVALAASAAADKLRLAALTAPEARIPMESRQVTPPDINSCGSVTAYGTPQ